MNLMEAIARHQQFEEPLITNVPAETVVGLPGGQEILASVAADPVSRARGLMWTSQLAADRGLLMVYPHDYGIHKVWMLNTWIALDAVWLDASGAIVEIHRDLQPCTGYPCAGYGGRRRSQFILELPAGAVHRYGLRIGDPLQL